MAIVVDVLLCCGVGWQTLWVASGHRKAHGPSIGTNLRDYGCISRCEPFSVLAPAGTGAAV